jgi:hypothetical protein
MKQKLTVTMPFDWDGKPFAVGDQITDEKEIDGIRNGKTIPNPKDKRKNIFVHPAPANHYVVVSTD